MSGEIVEDDDRSGSEFGHQDFLGACGESGTIHSAIIASALSPAIRFCMPHEPNGASMTRRFPRDDQPRWRIRLVFNEFSSTARQSLLEAMIGNKGDAFRLD